jgi:membrane-associated PAP2 superfamily phosphatase
MVARREGAMRAVAPIGSMTRHVWIPLAAFVLLAMLLESTRIDVWLADAIYRWEGGAWSLRRDPIVRDLLHNDAKRVIGVVYGVLVLACVLSYFLERLAAYRGGLVYMVVAVAGSTLLVALLKDITHVNCPWSVDRYGGDVPYLSTWREVLLHGGSGRCFPSGHAGSGYALVGSYFYCRRFAPRWRWLALGAALGLGVAFGVAQQLRGAHYLSHDVWALAICWFVAVAATPLLKRADARVDR